MFTMLCSPPYLRNGYIQKDRRYAIMFRIISLLVKIYDMMMMNESDKWKLIKVPTHHLAARWCEDDIHEG